MNAPVAIGKPGAVPACFCGSVDFEPGPEGRLSWGGKPPKCSQCNSLERHRAIRNVYAPLLDLLMSRSCLQFARDISVDPTWFRLYECSHFGRENSLDVMAIDRDGATYDWVILNHVLEHVRDDVAALGELGRVTRPSGVIHLTIPNPTRSLQTNDWGYADPETNEHYRAYGSDFPDRIRQSAFDGKAIQVVAPDPVTGDRDIIYFLSQNFTVLESIGSYLMQHGIVVLHAM